MILLALRLAIIIQNYTCRELLDDANFHTAIKNVADEPVPYFDQFSTRNEPSDSVRHSASRHIYASGLASLPSGHDFPPHSSHMPHSHTSSQSSLSEDVREMTATQSQCNDSPEVEDTIAKRRSQDRTNAEIESNIKRYKIICLHCSCTCTGSVA